MLTNNRRNKPKFKKLFKFLILFLIILFIFSRFSKNRQSQKSLTISVEDKITFLQTVSKNSDLCKAFSENSKYLTDKYCEKSTGKKSCKIADISKKDLVSFQKDLEGLITLCANTQKQ